MAYEWYWEHCHPQITSERFPKGVPHCKLANVCLEKDGELKTFLTQEETDAAWADGWHEPGKPETADVPRETPVIETVEEAIEKVMPECKPKRGPGRPKKTRLFEKGK